MNSNHLKSTVTSIMLELGVPTNLKGYHYLREGIIYLVSEDNETVSMTKILYPYLARVFRTSPPGVERAIRNAIDLSWTRGNKSFRRRIFGYIPHDNIRKPKNSEFMLAIADRLRLM